MMLTMFKRLALPLVALFLILAIAARALGTTQPPNPALAGFTEGCEDKPQPCWYGIVPGTTTMEEAKYLLSNYANSNQNQIVSSFCVFVMADFEQGVISLNCLGVYLGDMMSVVGIPDEVRIAGGSLDIIWFKASTLVSIADRKENWLSPHSKINGIFSAAFYGEPRDDKIRWFGFVANWRYCRLLNLPTDECTRPPIIGN